MQKTLNDKTNTKKQSKAEEMAARQREISVAEFFEKNRHLLGFDNKRKALLTTIKEAVDNALDACEEANIFPEIAVELIDMGNDRFRVVIEDNGPGIVKAQVSKIFAKLLYGSKFHSLKQSRGQQGIGISAAVLYGQLTTGRPARIKTKHSDDQPAYYCELTINTLNNKPEIHAEKELEWSSVKHGTRIEIDLEGSYNKGAQSVDEYLKETAITNPHATIFYTNPKAEQFIFAKAVDKLPKLPKEIKPHPDGIELGILIKMVAQTPGESIQQFLTTAFSRVSVGVAKDILDKAGIDNKTKTEDISRQQCERIMAAIKETKIQAPPTDCIFPIGSANLEKGLKKEIPAEFFCAVTRTPTVYRGNPFTIEVALAYGGDLKGDGSASVLRFANRVPLLYQQGACASSKAIQETGWRSYGLQQSKGSLPQGPLVIVLHIASVWAPFTSEAKEAIAHYPEIIKEMKLALQEAGRKLGKYVRKKKKAKDAQQRVDLYEKYIPEVAYALAAITGKSKVALEDKMKGLLQKNKEFIDSVKEDAKNEEYGTGYGLTLGSGNDDGIDDEYENSDEKGGEQ